MIYNTKFGPRKCVYILYKAHLGTYISLKYLFN